MLNKKIKFSIVIIIILAALPVGAYVASSPNYRLQSDSLNFSGQTSSSSNYNLEDTVGEVGSGTSTALSYNINAGYQAMSEDTYITISSPGSVSLSPNINPSAGGVSNASASWTVNTNNPSGYTLSVSSASSPALSSSNDSFNDLPVAVGNTIFSWSVPSSQAYFGYTADGVDLSDSFLDNGSACEIHGGNDSTNNCWAGFSTTPFVVSSKATATTGLGSVTTFKMRAETTTSRALKDGNYQATINVLAVAA